MLRTLTLAATTLAALTPFAASATPIASDSFSVDGTAGNGDYNVGNLIGQDSDVGITGFTGNWGVTGGSTGDLDADTGGLTSSLTPGTTLPGLIRTDGGGGSIRSVFHEFTSVPDSDQYFYSFLLNSGASTVASLGLTPIGNVGSQPNEGVRVGVDSTDGDDIVLIVDSTRINVLEDYVAGTTYFVLVDITNDDAGLDSITASVFSDTATDVSGTPLGAQTLTGEISADLTHLAAVRRSTNGGAAFTRFDEFRFGTELSDVAIVPEPASLALAGLGGLCLLGRRRRA